MKKIAVILATVILVFGFVTTGVLSAQTQAQPQMSEKEMEEIQKLVQQEAISRILFDMNKEKDITEKFIQKLENFQTSDAVLFEKINKWLPVFKEYLKSIVCAQAVLLKFSECKDLIPKQEINDSLFGCYSQKTEYELIRVLNEISSHAAILEMLRKN